MAEPAPKAAVQKVAKTVAVEAKKVTESAQHLEKSAGVIERSTDRQLESALRRTQLAADRTVLAAERTYSAWVPDWLVRLTGSVLVAFSLFCFVAAVWRQLQPGVPPPEPDTKRLPAAILIGMNGLLALAAIAALVEIWFTRL